ncbi:MAG: hypothetical protein V4813_00050 [Gemmatimonadota bacterium]
MSEPRVVPRVAESALFGHVIASTDVVTAESIADVLAVAHDTAVDLLVVRVPVGAAAAIHQIERAGGLLCDTLQTFQREPRLSAPSLPPLPEDVRLATPSDAAALHALSLAAFASFRGHWHADHRLLPSASTCLYAQWSADLARAVTEATPVVVSVDPAGSITAFLALAQRDPQTCFVPLAAVGVPSRGRRLLGALLQQALGFTACLGADTLQYETQIDNLPAIRAVTREGFVPHSLRHTFHLWLSAQ